MDRIACVPLVAKARLEQIQKRISNQRKLKSDNRALKKNTSKSLERDKFFLAHEQRVIINLLTLQSFIQNLNFYQKLLLLFIYMLFSLDYIFAKYDTCYNMYG